MAQTQPPTLHLGQTLAFTVIVNDVPSAARSPISSIDALLADIAAAN